MDNRQQGGGSRDELEAAAAGPERVSDLVRRAYGEPLPGLAGEPENALEAAEARDDAGAALLQGRYLTEGELEALPEAEAEAVALGRFADEAAADEGAPPVIPGNVGSLDDVPGDAAVGAGGEVAALVARVDRLERQLAEMVKRFAGRLSEHERRLDRVDEPPERSWLKR